jgi:formylglycine-generating enzyme required for sulfatase activity
MPPAATPTPIRRGHRAWSAAIARLSQSGRQRWWAVAGVLLLGSVVAWAAVVLKVKTADGVIVVENVPENAVVEVDGDRITVTPAGSEPIQIERQPGKYVVIVRRGDEVLLGESVTLQSGKTFKLTVRHERAVLPPAPKAGAGESTARSEASNPAEPAPGAVETKPPAPPTPPAVVDRTLAKRLTNSIKMELVLIPSGEFLMGSHDTDQSAEDDEKPQHRVQITRPFYLGATEVTQGQYQAVMGENPSNFKGSDDLPVETVSWLDAVKFCNKLSEREGRKPCYRIEGVAVTIAGGDGYRLPTEAEWEYACRAGSSTRYPFGDDENGLGGFAWYGKTSEGKTHPVGQKRPNAWGLHDMLGNVWEWCSDGYDFDYYKQLPVDDPPGADGASYRVIRGGGWSIEPRYCRSAFRLGNAPGDRSYSLGLRLALGQSGR